MPEPAALVTSIRALAPLVGRSHAAVALWVKRDDWPFGEAPWPRSMVDDIKAWATANLREDRSAPEPSMPAVKPAGTLTDELSGLSTKQKLELQKQTVAIKKMQAQVRQLELAMGDYVPRAEVEAMNVRRIHAVKTELMNTMRLVAMLEPFVRPDNLPDVDEIIRRWGKGVCDRFAGQDTAEALL